MYSIKSMEKEHLNHLKLSVLGNEVCLYEFGAADSQIINLAPNLPPAWQSFLEDAAL